LGFKKRFSQKKNLVKKKKVPKKRREKIKTEMGGKSNGSWKKADGEKRQSEGIKE